MYLSIYSVDEHSVCVTEYEPPHLLPIILIRLWLIIIGRGPKDYNFLTEEKSAFYIFVMHRVNYLRDVSMFNYYS
jgi:hypothetical protein